MVTTQPERNQPTTTVLDAEPAPDDPTLAEADLPSEPGGQPMTQRRVLGLAIPIIGENLLHTSVSAVDVFMVAQLGAVAVAGVGTAAEIVYFMISILSAASIGATVLVSQAIGAGDKTRANRLARQGVVWGIALAVPVSTIGYFAAPGIIGLFGTAPDVAAAATTYLRIIAATTVILLLSFMCSAILRGAGDSRTPLVAAILANVINVVAAWLLIFGNLGLPALGVAGSAVAAVLGRGAGAALLLTLLARGRRVVSLQGRSDWLPRFTTAIQLFRLGIPAGLEQMLVSAGFTTMVAVVAMIGTASLAAQQIGFTALSIAFMPGFGFGMAATALVGQSFGARNIQAARTAVTIALRWGIVWMVAGAIIYFVFARQIMGLFTRDTDVLSAGVAAMMALSLSLPGMAVWTVCGGGLRGSGDTRSPMISSVLAVWLAVGLAYAAVRWFDAGLGTVWLMFSITAPLAGIRNALILRRRLAKAPVALV